MKFFLFKPVFLLLSLCPAFLPLFSCAARINGSLASDGSAALSVSMALEPRMAALIQRLAVVGGQANGQAERPILDGPAIARSMSNAPSGNVSASLKNSSPSAIEGQVQISNISRFLAVGDTGGFISFEQGRTGGRCEISISRDNGPIILEIFSREIADYLSALMSPLATGEELSKTEYLELVSSIYTKAISDEIAGSRIRASIDFPGSVTSVKGGTFSGRKANFDIPLLDLLVLETPIIYTVIWGQ